MALTIQKITNASRTKLMMMVMKLPQARTLAPALVRSAYVIGPV
ncbi:Uncharacterised protein [Bordetella pertussis]|nr:Uncharacterised protein [Bordetella pertussis]CFO70035.1 Uncharacterised protein [Bordetella pertussis]CFP59728.1 Uncharacterised protein [Bordetella pertussis]CFU81069.1 Uncharacterised protein [Bordetella pertussis]CPH90602.1 Uncharacterised protein [Bordetella pertussis]